MTKLLLLSVVCPLAPGKKRHSNRSKALRPPEQGNRNRARAAGEAASRITGTDRGSLAPYFFGGDVWQVLG